MNSNITLKSLASYPIKCDEEVVKTVLEAATEVDTGKGRRKPSYMIESVNEQGGKGTYMIIGTDNAAPHHYDKFEIQEDIQPRGVQLLKRAAMKLLK
ncbi:hypothetical protein MOD48_05675 [Bacillus spizizenii]|nr:hypothetical protein [Bacillus spizizenii]MCY7841118.1 hypothetical protein [Bacillus spizizenii]MCY7868662.1 hypothetical protein [Bacillus spizizenii]MCY8602602.1 hypothetical protein [Bacillus spizizenii]MCY8621931.1 hypothetical protein [Bacillus spizizenii]